MFTIVRLCVTLAQLYIAVQFIMLALVMILKADWVGVVIGAGLAWAGWAIVRALERVGERLSDV
jgi:hypothetical protein